MYIYQKFANAIHSLKRINGNPACVDGWMRDKLEEDASEIMAYIIQSCPSIEKIEIAYPQCTDEVITLHVTAVPTPNYKTETAFLMFRPNWIGIKFDKLTTQHMNDRFGLVIRELHRTLTKKCGNLV